MRSGVRGLVVGAVLLAALSACGDDAPQAARSASPSSPAARPSSPAPAPSQSAPGGTASAAAPPAGAPVPSAMAGGAPPPAPAPSAGDEGQASPAPLPGLDPPQPATVQPPDESAPTDEAGPPQTDAFLAYARTAPYGAAGASASDDVLLDRGLSACDGLDALSFDEVVSGLTTTGPRPTAAQADAFVREAVRRLCAQKTQLLPP